MTCSVVQPRAMTDITEPHPTEPAPFSDDDPRASMAGAVALCTAVIDAVAPDELHLPTPCDEMDVRRLLGHLVMVLQRVAAAGRDEDPATWPGEVTGLDDAAWAPAWRDAAHEVQAGWIDDTILDRPTRLPWGLSSGREVLGIYTNEVTVHTWDLARATGQSVQWDDRVLAASFAAIQASMPAEGRAELYQAVAAELPPDAWEDPFGPAVTVADNASLIDRLVAWNGRRP